jgi:hypothetical protein
MGPNFGLDASCIDGTEPKPLREQNTTIPTEPPELISILNAAIVTLPLFLTKVDRNEFWTRAKYFNNTQRETSLFFPKVPLKYFP